MTKPQRKTKRVRRGIGKLLPFIRGKLQALEADRGERRAMGIAADDLEDIRRAVRYLEQEATPAE